ncbi:DUF6103 family protein [Pseudoflavonifractor phocaeensis]|uniref:DUF6103 family protein n=1 Tax=Pseudoflavonifractor phocaeensis TaxID=1870988 RepID=UPI00210BBE02|nr:DUF6103 family protein [Pseudoflavonifractor phocaeensis]MCQ4863532.1 DUF6103 family protein [Pseudoflavonifractor phocaeensis]
MKHETVTIRFEQERLKALQFYAAKKGGGLEAELDAFMEKLYEKYVPSAAKEYIEMLSGEENARPQRPSRPSRQEPGA